MNERLLSHFRRRLLDAEEKILNATPDAKGALASNQEETLADSS
jgi:hypothetical protein